MADMCCKYVYTLDEYNNKKFILGQQYNRDRKFISLLKLNPHSSSFTNYYELLYNEKDYFITKLNNANILEFSQGKIIIESIYQFSSKYNIMNNMTIIGINDISNIDMLHEFENIIKN